MRHEAISGRARGSMGSERGARQSSPMTKPPNRRKTSDDEGEVGVIDFDCPPLASCVGCLIFPHSFPVISSKTPL